MLKLNRHYLLSTILLAQLPLLNGCQRVSHSETVSQNTPVLALETNNQNVQLNSEVQMVLEQSAVLERVKDIFRIVEEDQNSLEGLVESGLCDQMFCSKSWNELLDAVREKENVTCMPCFEVDYWHMTRDPEFVTFDDFRVSHMLVNGKNTASVSFTVYDANEEVPARVDLVFEDGRWLIDNFYHLKSMLNLKHSMWYYLNNIDVI